MIEDLKHLFNKAAVTNELKKGALPSSRMKSFLIAILFFSMAVNFLTTIINIFIKERSAPLVMQLIAVLSAGVVIVVAFFIFKLVLSLFYEANGGESGAHLLERIFLLGANASLRASLVLIPAMILISSILSVASGPMVATLGVALFCLSMGVLVWIILEVKKGLEKLKGSV